MKKLIFGIFAHPDDEAFGPSGTLLKEVRSGNDVHLITLTAGEAGVNPDNSSDLATVRLAEWRTAGALIGAASMHYLGFKDSQLCNTSMVEIQQKLIDITTKIIARYSKPIEIEFITIDLNGVTGHIDHIVAARAASFAFYTLKKQNYPLTRIRYACLPASRLQHINTGWIFMEPGRCENEIDEIVDAREYKDEIIEIIRAHHTQRADAANHLKVAGDQIAFNHFIIRT